MGHCSLLAVWPLPGAPVESYAPVKSLIQDPIPGSRLVRLIGMMSLSPPVMTPVVLTPPVMTPVVFTPSVTTPVLYSHHRYLHRNTSEAGGVRDISEVGGI